MRFAVWLGAVLALGGSAACAQNIARPAGNEPIEVITPVFHQLLAYSSPANMVLHIAENSNDHFYKRVAVRDVDTLSQWGQEITVTGDKGAAQFQPEAARGLANKLVNGFQAACPNYFGYKDIGAVSGGSTPTYLVLVGCGNVEDKTGRLGSRHSETALIVVLQGDQDLYTIQWAERSTPQDKPPVFNDAKWQKRFQQLQPIRVCNIKSGEKAPYPSCLNGTSSAGH